MIAGAFCWASSKASRKLASDSPPLLAIISGPLITTTYAPVSSTKALAINVFPLPGGPCNKIPLGVGTPAVVQSSGNRSGNSTNSLINFVADSSPPTESYPNPIAGRGALPPTTACVCAVNSPATVASAFSFVSSSDNSFSFSSSSVAPSIVICVTKNSNFRPLSSTKIKSCPRFNNPPVSSRYGAMNLSWISSSEIVPSNDSKANMESSMGENVNESTVGTVLVSTNTKSPLWEPSFSFSVTPIGTILILSPLRSRKFLATFSDMVQTDNDGSFFFFCFFAFCCT